MSNVDFFAGDPLKPDTPKLGPLTMTAYGNGNVVLQNLSGADLVAGPYRVPVNRYLNQQSSGWGQLGLEGSPGQIGPWEQWRVSGNLIVAWNGFVYALVQRPQL